MLADLALDLGIAIMAALGVRALLWLAGRVRACAGS